jgi:hypothetical protein
MSMSYVHRYAQGAVNAGGTIKLDASLNISEVGTRTIKLNPSIFNKKGTWKLYDYVSLIGPSGVVPVGPVSSIIVDASALTTLGLSGPTFTPVNTGASLTVTLS